MTDAIDMFDDLESIELPPQQHPDEPPVTAPDGPSCDVCGTPIEWSGRGRRPKKCSEHKTRTSGRAASGTAPAATRRNQKMEARLEQLRGDLTFEMAVFGKTVAKVMQTTGVVIVGRSERTATALVRIAQDNPKVLDALEIGAKIAPALDLGETAGALLIALMVDMGRISPDNLMSTLFGVSAVWHELNDDNEPVVTGEGYAGVGLPPVDVPLRFQPVK